MIPNNQLNTLATGALGCVNIYLEIFMLTISVLRPAVTLSCAASGWHMRNSRSELTKICWSDRAKKCIIYLDYER